MPSAEEKLRLFVSAPAGIAERLQSELSSLGVSRASVLGAGVQCRATLAEAYRICLWSRLASRVLLRLSVFDMRDEQDLYRAVREIDWPAVFPLEATFAVRSTLDKARLTHTGFAAQRVKDAVADAYRAACGKRPSVDRTRPDVRLHLHVQRSRATLSLDLAGEGLHRRGYRESRAAAPLKENLAAAILDLLGWPGIADRDGALLDPMCGSGTLLLEGAMMAANLAPGLHRERFGFHTWHGHDPEIWQGLLHEAHAVQRVPPPVVGCDINSAALRRVREAAQSLGLEDAITLHKRALDRPLDAGELAAGLLVSNPPYGVRMGESDQLPALYRQLGQLLRRYPGWRTAVFTGNPDLVHRLRIPAVARHKLRNGTIPCVLFDFGEMPRRGGEAVTPAAAVDDNDAFGNRLRKNMKHLRRWARRENIDCYRLYDADIPEYAFAIDYFGGELPQVQVQEYAAPDSVVAAQAAARRALVMSTTGALLALPDAQLHYKMRRRQRGSEQYRRHAGERRFDIVDEHGLRFYVNFHDYLDTGLFLHHRLTRRRIHASVAGRSFLNLFAYTGAATVCAAAGSASSTTSVDLSQTYLNWADDNLALNDLTSESNSLLRADCLAWIADAARDTQRWDYIFLDPPSFSNSKSMRTTLDIQRDHVALLHAVSGLLAPQGVLLFATNKRRFKLDAKLADHFVIRDLTVPTTPPDFARRPAHRCWEIRCP
ncbi:MAG: bifunctional 23S rRNA (guanine(2069)-N(7))-methyltransferase RlmK/23S rRNA (guanine(2445)-N(2))-methyltransferase RlmL [Gammaproteobacteria bacterium]|nr:bifunctional 23S rRNA (guanine(2069)-N(7))-methyltransferase RlmK/23S rRNA (guanine(2445)-N(2))-methyltransferase RlmL [Gammaproteobacteria bacterium]